MTLCLRSNQILAASIIPFLFTLQAPKKAKRRQGGGEGGSSNVFSMFEQSQIQEYKEVRFPTPTLMLHRLEPGPRAQGQAEPLPDPFSEQSLPVFP